MIIALCGSMSFHKEMEKTKKELEKLGHVALLPHTEYNDFHELRAKDEKKWFSLKPQFIRDHFDKVKESDAVIILNYEKNGIKNYVGGNSVFEIGLAFDLGKKIFLMNPIPAGMPYTEELEVINPVILNGDLKKIK